MYEDLSLSQLHRFLAVAQTIRLHGECSDEVKQIAKTVIEELQQAIADKAKESNWKIGDKKIKNLQNLLTTDKQSAIMQSRR